ncbi:MAG: ISAs1 family transposase [Bacillota bacterium]
MKEGVYRKVTEIELRPIHPIEEEKWNKLMKQHHYLGFERLTGETLKYVAIAEGEWIALIGWGTAAFKCIGRDSWIGWRSDLQWKRLKYIANNQRFLVFPWIKVKNLASRILALNVKRISDDWEKAHGHPIVLVETFVETGRFTGACYKAAGWQAVGETKGYGRNGGKYYYHGITKGIYVKEVVKGARDILTADAMLPQLMGKGKVRIEVNSVAVVGPGGLFERLSDLKDLRKKKGKQHPYVAVLAISVLAGFAGIKSYLGMEDFAKSLSQEELKLLGCKYDDWDTQRYLAPSDTTFSRVLQQTNSEEFDLTVGEWTSEQIEYERIAIDGKKLRGARLENGKHVNLVAAVAHGSGEVLAQQEVDEKSNEIPAAEPLLNKIDIKGKVITADALHTQVNLANYIKKREADYVLIVKDNQGNLKKEIAALEDDDFSP